MFSTIMTLFVGIYLIVIAVIVTSSSRLDKLLFKVLPALLGVFLLFQGLDMLGILTINW